MARSRFRLFDGTYRDHDPAPRAERPIRLRELLPLLADARINQHAWLEDFLDDEVVVTADLHDVLQAFRMLRPTA